MRILPLLAVIAFAAGAATGQDVGNALPDKVCFGGPVSVPAGGRPAGDKIEDALEISDLPFLATGSTVGYIDNYDEVCPYEGSTAPDVVYRYRSPDARRIDIDLCGSRYDTKVYVYDEELTLIACNDDYYYANPCGVYASKLRNVALQAGGTYYIVIDGYGEAAGDYVLDVDLYQPCVISLPVEGVDEGEPPLADDYVDHHNGGCNTPGELPFMAISSTDGTYLLRGRSGWYTAAGAPSRDTDWFILHMGPDGAVEITANAEFQTFFFELRPQDCGNLAVIEQMTAGACNEVTMTIAGYAPDAPIWLWVGPTVYIAPTLETEYDYVIWFSGLSYATPVAAATWGAVKALYD